MGRQVSVIPGRETRERRLVGNRGHFENLRTASRMPDAISAHSTPLVRISQELKIQTSCQTGISRPMLGIIIAVRKPTKFVRKIARGATLWMALTIHRAPASPAQSGSLFINVPSPNLDTAWPVPDPIELLSVTRVHPREIRGEEAIQNIIGLPVAMLASQRSFMLVKNSFSDSARISLEWSTVLTSFSSAGDSLTEIQSPVCVPS
jgi:hypothetical protein